MSPNHAFFQDHLIFPAWHCVVCFSPQGNAIAAMAAMFNQPQEEQPPKPAVSSKPFNKPATPASSKPFSKPATPAKSHNQPQPQGKSFLHQNVSANNNRAPGLIKTLCLILFSSVHFIFLMTFSIFSINACQFICLVIDIVP